MLSQKLLDEINCSRDIKDCVNVYENLVSKEKELHLKSKYGSLKTGLEYYLKETINNNLGKNKVGFLM